MMKNIWLWIKRLVFFAWCIVLAILGAWFCYENKMLVSVNYLGLGESEQTLGNVIFAMLLVGFLLGMTTNWLSSKTRVYWQKRKYTKVSRELENLKKAQAAD